MNKPFNKRSIGVGIGVAIGMFIMDLLDGGEVSWYKPILAGIITIFLFYLYEKLKK